jgi:hypothetical protein
MKQACSRKRYFILFFFLVVMSFSCSPGGDQPNPPAPTKGKMEFKLTDDPGKFAYFRIHITGLEYNESNDPAITTGWVTIPLQNSGIIDIIQYSNGRELPLGNLELLPVTVKQLRLKLGTQNSFGIYTFPFIGTVSFFDMSLHPSIINGLVIPFRVNVLAGGTNRIYFDFDATHSLVQTGSTTFELKPSVRLFEAGSVSGIEGKVFPPEARPYVRVIYMNHSNPPSYYDTAYGYPDATGYFKIIGLDRARAIPDSVAGIQKVEFIPRLFPPTPYQPQEKLVTLLPNATSNTGTITLTQ